MNFESNEKPGIPIEVFFSLKDEFSRIKNTIKRYKWYVENGYSLDYLDFPAVIKDKLEKGEEVSDEDIKTAVEKEYSEDKYKTEAEEIMKAWETESADFSEKLKSLGRPLPGKFYICITTYGSGGSYHYPNNSIELNINKKSKVGILGTVFHEMIHLVIEDLIQKYNIPHWTKERLVNLTINKFFPDRPTMQRDPENAKKVGEIFEREFPNIEKIIEEVSKL